MWDDYTVPGGTYRENLLNTPGHSTVPEGHPARAYRYDVLKEKYGDEKGNINIDKREPAKPVVDDVVEEKTEISEKVPEVKVEEVVQAVADVKLAEVAAPVEEVKGTEIKTEA